MEKESKKLVKDETSNAKCLYCDSELAYRVDYEIDKETYRVYLCERCDQDEIASFDYE